MTESVGRVFMIVENGFPGDSRVRCEAWALKEAGYDIIVLGLRDKEDPFYTVIEDIHVYRVRKLTLFNKLSAGSHTGLKRIWGMLVSVIGYTFEYFYFTTMSLVLSFYIYARHRFQVIHAHNPPDSLFLVAWPFKPLGVKFVFDHHDLSPELYQSRYAKPRDMLYRFLQGLESLSYKTANMVIATNESYKEIAQWRGRKNPDQVVVVRNGPDLKRIHLVPPRADLRAMGKTILAYLGALNPQDGVDYLLRALHILVHELKREDVYCVVVGEGDSLEDLRGLSRELQLEDYLDLPGFLPRKDMLATLCAADICVDPDPSSPLNDFSTWIKVMEYMALGKPIVTFDLKETAFSARDAAIYVEPNDEKGFAEAIITLMNDPERRERMGTYARTRIEKELQWDVVKQNLLKGYAGLLPHHQSDSSVVVVGGSS